MVARCAGLTPWAHGLVNPDGLLTCLGSAAGTEVSEYTQEGEWPLMEYRLPDGQVLREVVQAEYERTVFLALVDVTGTPLPSSQWSDEEMHAALVS